MRIFQGVTDTDITEIGQKQLKFLEKRFEAVHLDKIYSSPLIRTKKTAEAIKGKRDLDIEIFPEIIELNGGFVEAKPFKETFDAYPEMKDAWFNHPEDFAPEGGEAMRDAYIRSENAKDYIGHEFVTQGNINKNTWKRRPLTQKIAESITRLLSPIL